MNVLNSYYTNLKNSLAEKINLADSLENLDAIKSEIFGKTGIMSLEMKKLQESLPDQKADLGMQINLTKQDLSVAFGTKESLLKGAALLEKLKKEKVDGTIPQRSIEIGGIHIITHTITQITNILRAYGFEVKDGPDIETEYFNFEALNTGVNHPARQESDTFFLNLPENKQFGAHLLRTQTSSVQIRTMLEGEPPFKIISAGKTYRCDYDKTHTPMFHQIEGLYVDKGVNMGHLKSCIFQFLHNFFETEDFNIRFRPSYFPFTEPSAEVDISYEVKNDKIVLCKSENYLEVLGCGMVHPNVLNACKAMQGESNNGFTGFAFGMGVERLCMLKFGVADIRKLYNSSIAWNKFYAK